MKTSLLLLSLLLFTWSVAFGDPLTALVSNSQKVIQDPKTKVIYYLESDLRHIAAISPDGKLLWCCEVTIIDEDSRKGWHIADFKLLSPDSDGKDRLEVDIWESGYEAGVIDLKTGIYTGSNNVL